MSCLLTSPIQPTWTCCPRLAECQAHRRCQAKGSWDGTEGNTVSSNYFRRYGSCGSSPLTSRSFLICGLGKTVAGNEWRVTAASVKSGRPFPARIPIRSCAHGEERALLAVASCPQWLWSQTAEVSFVFPT